MANLLRHVIAALKSDGRFMGTCPCCAEDFRLSDAPLFALGDHPPAEALAAIAAMRERVAERKADLARTRERMTARAENTSRAVNLGRIIEQIVPSFDTFAYSSGDCRALFEPIEYLIFSGLTGRGEVNALVFAEVKSGRARLNEIQKSIKSKVEAGAVKLLTTQGGARNAE